MAELGLTIGRFQPFHIGHKLLVDTSLSHNPASLVLVGSSLNQDEQNPYSYDVRRELIESEYPDAIQGKRLFVGALPDFPTDEQWKDFLLSYIPDTVTGVHLYCGDRENDSAIQALLSFEDSLPFQLKIIEIPRSIIPISASQIRENPEDFSEYLTPTTQEILQKHTS